MGAFGQCVPGFLTLLLSGKCVCVRACVRVYKDGKENVSTQVAS